MLNICNKLKVRKIVAAVTLVLSLVAQAASAQTGEFKRDWTKIYDNVYFKTETLVDKLPSGETEFRVFGFKDKREVPADIEIEGIVTDSHKYPKGYKFIIDSCRMNYADENSAVKFTGSLTLSISNGYMKDWVTMMIVPLSGTWSVKETVAKDFTNYHILPAWEEQVGWLTVNIAKPEKGIGKPVMDIIYNDFILPRHVTQKVEFTREISNLLTEEKLTLSREDSVFLHSVLAQGSRVEKVPELEAVISEMPLKNDPTRVFDTELLYYKLGNKLGLSEADIKREGADYHINYHGIEPKYRFTATYNNSAFPEFTNVKWEDGSEFADDDMRRSDKSRITRIKFDIKENVLDMPRGFVISQALALSDFTNLDFFDFSKYFDDANLGKLSVGSYISPENVPVLIAGGNFIEPVKKRVEAERAEALRNYQNAKDRYDRAKAWLNNRGSELAQEYDVYSAGREVFEIPNNQAADPHDVKVFRRIKRVDAGYEEELYVSDVTGSYPIQIDEDGDACFTANGRTYWFTQFSDEARRYLDTYRMAKQNRAVLDAGEPEMPKF